MMLSTKIGVVLILAGVVGMFAAASIANNQLGSTPIAINLTVAPHGFAYTDIMANATDAVLMEVALSNSSNIYVFNKSAFSAWSSAANAAAFNGIGYAERLNGNSQLYLYQNTSLSLLSLPDSSRGTAYNYSRIYDGSYYVVIDSTNGSVGYPNRIVGKAVYVALGPEALAGYLRGQTLRYGGAIAAVVAGIAVAVFGFFRKGRQGGDEKTKADTTSKEYIDSLYKDIGGRGSKSSPGKRK